MLDIVVPSLGESITEATVAKWLKQVGEAVVADEPIVELETDKVAVEIPAPAAGVLGEILADVGTPVAVGGLLGRVREATEAAKAVSVAAAAPVAAMARVAAGAAVALVAGAAQPAAGGPSQPPSVRRLVAEHALDPGAIPASGRDGRLTKEDVLTYMHVGTPTAPPAKPQLVPPQQPVAKPPAVPPTAPGARPHAAREQAVRMTRLRQRIAQRLKEAQNTAAMLTTFNEVDMTAALSARAKYREAFEKRHGARLGLMSFFVKAATLALKELPAVNAEIDGEQLIYKNYYNIGVAVGTPQGLVVPVLKDADQLGFAEIEKRIADFGRRARDGKLTIEDMQGGTFTISNGGVYGSLMSTPILNPPQSAILGMHKIQDRPIALAGKVEVRPMMYLALSYDHRVIDGREAVTFLVRLKEYVEEPERLLLDV